MDSITNGWETLEFPSIDRLSRYRIVDRSINIVTNTPWAAMIEIPFRLEVIMGRKSGRAAPTLSDEQRSKLSGSAASRTAPVREVERAKVLLKYVQGLSISEIQRQLGVSRPMIYTCIDKALAAGVQAGLKDAYHHPRRLDPQTQGAHPKGHR